MIVGRVSCGFLIQQVRRVYIEEARKQIMRNDSNGRVTKSKLAMLTGLDTRTISAIEAEPANPANCTVGEICAEAGVLNRWMSQPEFRDENDEPKRLPILGKSISFQALVSSAVGRNVTYQTVLERLIESGNVEVIGDEFVELKNRYYQPVKTSEQTIIDAGSYSISRLSETVLSNFQSTSADQKLLQQDRWSRRIPRRQLPELKRKTRQLIETQILEMEDLIDLQEDMVRQAFEDLFNEQRALDGRVDRFVFYCDELLAAYREAYPHRPVNNHYHSDDYGMISLYLAFRYPAQYTLYDPVIFRTLLQQLGVQNLPQSNNIVRYFKVANTIYKLMQKEAKLLPLHRQRLQEGTHYLGDSLLVVYDFACMVTGLQGAAYDKK